MALGRLSMNPLPPVRPGLVVEPSEETVGCHLGDLAPAVGAVLQVFVDSLGRGIVEIAQAIRLQDLRGRMDCGMCVHGVSFPVRFRAGLERASLLIKEGRKSAGYVGKKEIFSRK